MKKHLPAAFADMDGTSIIRDGSCELDDRKEPCCMPAVTTNGEVQEPGVSLPPGTAIKHSEVGLPGGLFLMGDAFGDGYPYDGEKPLHTVDLSPFNIDLACVTVGDFSAFVNHTGYRTDAERLGSSAVFHLALMADEADIIGAYGMPWWLAVRGADWRHPYGPKSDTEDLLDHPVVHVSHSDALAYCAWAGRALPTESEWEYAARGGKQGLRFPWGNELEEGEQHRANVWQGEFPQSNSQADGFLTTAPALHYEPNGFGLYQMAGNVWEWCADWFSPNSYARAPLRNPRGPATGTSRVVRGGSYLCHDSYCNRYRLSARSSNTPNSSTGNMGFRTVKRG